MLFVDGLKHNLLSISQLCDMGNKVTFYPNNCFVSSLDEDKVIFSGERVENIYVIDLNKIDNKDVKYLMTIFHDTWTWHRRLGHANFELINDICKNELVIGLPKLKFDKDKPCDACQKGKQSKSSFMSSKFACPNLLCHVHVSWEIDIKHLTSLLSILFKSIT